MCVLNFQPFLFTLSKVDFVKGTYRSVSMIESDIDLLIALNLYCEGFFLTGKPSNHDCLSHFSSGEECIFTLMALKWSQCN